MTSTKIGVAIGACAAATIIALQWQQISANKQTVKQFEAQVELATQQARAKSASQAEIEKLREQNAAYAKTIEGMHRDVAKARAHANAALTAKQAAAAGAKGNPLADMFKDPDLLEAMRGQLTSTTKTQYAPLVKQLKLSPEEADKFYQILVDRGMKGFDAVQTGNFSQDGAKSTEADLQSLLGDAGYALYNDFTQTMTAQSMLSLMTKDFTDNPLSDSQQQQLLQAMKTASQGATANSTPDLSQTNASDRIGAMMGQQMQLQDQVNQNVLQQAAAFLSPDQLQSLATSQSNMMAMQKVGMTMAQKMFTKAPAGQ
jgi:hypothetical protein